MSNNFDKKDKEESNKFEETKNDEEQMEINPEKKNSPEQMVFKEEFNPEKEFNTPKIMEEKEESKIDKEFPQIIDKKIKREVPIKITNDLVRRKFDYSKKISPITYMSKNQKKKELKMTEEEKEKNRKILYNMNLKLNFVKNPRYRNNIPPPRYFDNNYQQINHISSEQ